ncbi:conserved hypothetical protein [Anaeromyxobacter sp. K]|uniref:hypothetical protein n=1 Tax=Anaeromyxobacter sp. (strain K) TaxID=447217 RepID=UPI00015F9188|nr:hypothetical protein [Anaeromyxobacter sp. K]ACG73480.1 conserved hypothetical protein [Anaeromyxobacter sp. K]
MPEVPPPEPAAPVPEVSVDEPEPVELPEPLVLPVSVLEPEPPMLPDPLLLPEPLVLPEPLRPDDPALITSSVFTVTVSPDPEKLART